MNFQSLIAKDWFVLPIVGICVFTIAYLWNERVISWLRHRSLGQREEVIRLMKVMHIKVDEKRVTMFMLLSSFGLGFLFFLIFWPNLWAGTIFAVAMTIAGWSFPTMYVNFMYERRAGQFVTQMVDGLTLMANGIKAGLTALQSMERVRQNLTGPIAQEFGYMVESIKIGQSQEQALNELAIRIPKPDVIMFVTSVNILAESGGNMGETFQTIVSVIRERQKVEQKIEALTAQSMMQGMIITAVPFVMLLVFAVADPAYVKPLFNTVPGIFALLIILVLQVIGGLMIRKIVKINV